MKPFPPMPLLPITSPETIGACKSLELRENDIYICSYPKSGTTWTQHIVLSLVISDRRYRLQNDKIMDVHDVNLDYDHVSDFAPFFEIDAHWDLDSDCLADSVRKNHNRLGRRVFNTHLRWEMLPKHAENSRYKQTQQNPDDLRPECGKFIYVTRSLLDVCASFFHHLSNQKEGTYTESYRAFARDWMAGKVAFGSPLHHLLSFAHGFNCNSYLGKDKNANSTKDQPLLLLSYQDMKADLRGQVMRIIDFLNLQNIPMDVLENEILPSFEFQSMKDNSHRFQPKSVTWLNGFQFLRKGEVGDGKNLMVREDEKKCDEDGGVKDEMPLLDEYVTWVEKEGYNDLVKKSLGDVNDNYVLNTFLGLVDV